MVVYRSQPPKRPILLEVLFVLFCFCCIHLPPPACGQEMKKYLQFDHATGSSQLIPSVIKYQPDYGHAQARTRKRPARQLNSLTATNLQAEAANNYGYGNEIEYGGYASAGTHGGGHGHGHGGGGGHGQDCNSALGLLGMLGLVSFLQNILRQMTTTRAPAGRRKRDLDDSQAEAEPGPVMDIDKITLHIIPHLMSIGQVLDGSAPLNCSMHALCSANKLLVKEIPFGTGQGHFIGRMLSDGVMNMLGRKYGRPKNKKMLGEIANAAHVGRTTQTCDAYRKLRCGRRGSGAGSVLTSMPWPGLKFSFPSWLG